MYTITPSGEHIGSITRDRDKHNVLIDLNSDEFCEFLTWVSNSKIPVHPDLADFHPGSHYFGTVDELVAFCKGLMVLYVDFDPRDDSPALFPRWHPPQADSDFPPTHTLHHPSQLQFMPPQQNSWASLGSGNCPS